VSGLAALLAGRVDPGIYLWHGAFEVEDVRHAVEHAGWGFGHVDGWLAGGKAGFLAAVGRALAFPEWYGQNFDALADCLHDVGGGAQAGGQGDVGAGVDGVLLLWDGWSTLARDDEKAFSVALSVLGSRVHADRGVPFAVLLRGEGPEVPGLPSLD
jgi:Barstar (barnase inhibitor)